MAILPPVVRHELRCFALAGPKVMIHGNRNEISTPEKEALAAVSEQSISDIPVRNTLRCRALVSHVMQGERNRFHAPAREGNASIQSFNITGVPRVDVGSEQGDLPDYWSQIREALDGRDVRCHQEGKRAAH